MDPITLAAITSGVTAVKGLLQNANDLKDIYGQIDTLLGHTEEADKPKPKKKLTRQQQILRMRTGGGDGSYETDISEAADAVLARKAAQHQLDLLKAEINKKWPVKHGEQTTWDAILEEREKRIKAKEERLKKAKEAAEKKRKHDRELLHKVLMEGGKAIAIILSITGVGYFLYLAAQKGGSL